MTNLTIKDVARIAGVSPTVVSFVINNKPGVSEKTRQKVLDVVKKTNFRPSISSRRLILKKSFNISIVIRKDSSPFSNLFYFEIAQKLLDRSKEFGYNIVFTDIPQYGQNFSLPEIIKQKDTDGVVFFQDTELFIINEIEKLGIPCVVIDAHPDNSSYTCIKADYQVSAFTATTHLIEKGHRDIAFIGSSFVPNFYTQVFTGFKRALDGKGISTPSSWIQIDAFDEASSYECMERIMDTNIKPTAVFCAADFYAISALKCAKEKGLKAPDDISFISIDDIVLAKYIEPALTTIRIDKSMMGSLAMEMIIKRINGEQVESHTVASDHLVVRNSVKDLTANISNSSI